MEDLTEDEMLIRAMEESLRHYEEFERPFRELADVEAPRRNSTATRPNEVVRPPESNSRSSWPNSSGFAKQPVTKPVVTESSSASTFKPATSSRVEPPRAVPSSSRIDPKPGPSTANSWSNSSVAKPGPSTANSWSNSSIAKPSSSTTNSWGNSNAAKPGPSTANSWGNSSFAKPGSSTANSWGNSSFAKPGSSTANSWGNSSFAKPGSSTANSWGNSNAAKPGSSTANSWGNSNAAKPGPSRGNSTLPSLWQTMGTKRAATEPEVEDEVQVEEADGTLQLLSDSKTLTDDGFCMFTGRHWVYPTNYPERKYQLDMVQTALFHNTLVCLPTGLGKTFIAAVVMYNFYRWYPKGKIIFMAPTKPLVAQQIKACYDITGIPKEHTEELTGTMNVERRTQAWKNKRVFFATPQVVANDLVAQVCPAEEIRCLVVDEAHRAQGDFAYCQVVSTLRASSTNFRMLALSATPGTDIKAVQQVLANLHISKLKIATEDSPEIAQYTHHREVEIVTVAATRELNEARDDFQIVMGQYLRPLIESNLVSGYNLSNLTMFQMKTNLDKLTKQPPSWMTASELSRMKNLCLVCITLCHAQELLQNYGLRSFLSNIQGVLQDSKTNKVVSGYLSRDEDLLKLIHDLNEKLNGRPKEEGEKTGGRPTILYGHPKLQKLQQIVADHFYDYDDRQESTRAIIFCQYRDSVEEIKNMLKVLEPVVKPMSFVGQAKSKGSVGLTQKQQLQVMRDFRSGDFNTLISTSVGEEGLDIGEVDLIVCMDANKSPIRLMQRMGRTGRKRAGKIIMLLSEGREHKKYIDSTKKQSSISKNILNNQKLLPVLNQNSSPKMIPQGLSPKVYKTVLVIPREPKEQDIRKVMRKASALPDLLPAFLSPAEVAKWDGTVPEFSHLETTVNTDLLAFRSLESIFEWSSQESLLQKPPGLDLYDFLEWQRSLQGSDEAPHSKDSMALAALLQLADKMTLNNPELLTQTTDLVTEVDHGALWSTLKSTKGQGRGKRGRPAKEAPPAGPRRGDIAWCLQKQGQKRVPEISLEDASDFVLPAAQKSSELDVSLPAVMSEALERLESSIDSLQIDPDTPVCQMFRRISLSCEALRKANNKHNNPDFLSLPPDINSVDTILATLRIEYEERLKVRVKQPDDDFSPDTLQQIDRLTENAPVSGKRTFNREPSSTSAVKILPKKSPAITALPSPLGKRSFDREPSTSTSGVKIIPNKSPEVTPPHSPEIEIIPQNESQDDIQIIAETKSPIKPYQPRKLHEMSQGMTDFLMNFDLGLEDDDCFGSLDVKQAKKIITPKKNGMTKVEVEKKVEVKTSGNNSSLMDFDVLDDNFVDVIPEKTESPRKIETKVERGNIPRAKLPEKPFQMNFDVRTETPVKTKVPEKKVETEKGNIPRAKSPEKPFQMNFDVRTETPVRTKVPEKKVETEKGNIPRAKSPEKPFQMSFDVLDDENDLFADIDISSWMGELEKRGYESQVRPTSPPLPDSNKPQVAAPSSPSLLSFKPNVPVKSNPTVSSKPSNNTPVTPAAVSKKSPDLFSEGEASSHINQQSKPSSSSPIVANPPTSQSSNVAAKASPNMFTSSSSSSSAAAMKGAPPSPISKPSTLSKSSNVAAKASPNMFTSSSSGSSAAAMKGTPPSPISKPATLSKSSNVAAKASPNMFTSSSSGSSAAAMKGAPPSPISKPSTLSKSSVVATIASPNIFSSSSSNSSVVAMKGTPNSPISKSSNVANKASPNLFSGSSSNSSVVAMKGTPNSPISTTSPIVATKTSPRIFTSSSNGSPLSRLKAETKKSSISPGDTLKLTPSSVNTTLRKSPDIFNFEAKPKSDSHQSKVPTDSVDLRPLKVPSKLSMKSRVVNGVKPDVKVRQNSTPDDDSFIEVTKRKSSERRQALIVSSDESSPEKRGNVDVDSSPDVRKGQRRRIVDNDSSPDVGKGQVRRRNVSYESSPDTRKDQGRSSSSDTTMKPSQSRHSITISSNDESSPEVKNKRKVHSISEEESPEAIVISSDDDEFKTSIPVKTSKRKSEKEHRKQAKKHKKNVRGFLDMEAEVSGDDDSADDMEDSQMDRYDESFIKAEATQADTSIDMRAQYLRSVRSPLQGHGRFKIPQLQPARGRLLSPGDHDDNDDSSYMNDSFCVDTEGEEEEGTGSSEDSHAELEALEAKLEKQKSRKKKGHRDDEVPRDRKAGKKRDRNSFSSQEDGVKKKKMKLNRIIVHSSSEDEEPAAVLPSSRPSPPPPPQATSTPVNRNMVRGFEDDYVDDDDIDALLAAINMTQEIEEQTKKQASMAQESREQPSVVPDSKKPASRSLFNDEDRPSTSKSLRRQADLSDDEWEVPTKPKTVESKPGPSGSGTTKTLTLGNKVQTASRQEVPTKPKTVESKPGPSGSGTTKTLSLGNRVQTASRQEVATKPSLGLKQQSRNPQATTGPDVSEDCKEIPRKTLSLASKQTVNPSEIRQESTVLEHRTVPENRSLKNTLSLVKPVSNLPKLSDPSKDLERTAVVPPVVVPKAGPSTNEVAASSSRATVASNQQTVGNPVIIVSTRQVVSAPKLLTILRNTHKISAKFQTLPSGIDYVVSQRLAISRMQLQDVSSYNEKSDVVSTVRSVRQQFKFAVLVLENNASRPVPEPWKETSRHSLPGAKAHRTALCLMRQVEGLKVVFTKDQAETANIIQKLALKEHQCKYGIKQYCKESCDPAFDARLKFFTNLPGVNIALALKLVHQFPVMANFIKSCSSIEGIEKTLGINKRQAATLHQVLSKPLQ